MEAKTGVMQPQAKNTRSLQKLKSKGRKYRGTSTPDSAESPSLQKSHFRMKGARLMGLLLAMTVVLHVALSLRIAAFNIQTFGETKMSNATLSTYIVQILNRYDIALVQEVRDSHLTAVGKLLDRLNQDDPNTYHYVVSEPLGRNSYKERYLFVFRPDQVSAMDSYQYDDGCEPCGNDTFSREPAIVKFFSPFTQIKEFAIVPLHAAPSDAVAEIDSLYDVYLDVRKKWDIEVKCNVTAVSIPGRSCLMRTEEQQQAGHLDPDATSLDVT
ncbi:deoxyribonuclease-1 isoform X8 [Pteropus alecto]|uniref:deoxyribonuclease-1 isoform X8 n=1 Tax=Pteropus alecto TaxID=9402 RepID=UPI000D53A69E|nr:deoxyribonuclease-1 isoform X8 [Pteropus alecto]